MGLRATAALLSVRFLSWQRGLEGFMCLIGMAWAIGVMLSPECVQTGCNFVDLRVPPYIMAIALLITCSVGIVGMYFNFRYLRMQTSFVAFIVWATRAETFFVSEPRLWHVILIHSCFALAELSIYARILTGLDSAENQIKIARTRGSANVGDD